MATKHDRRKDNSGRPPFEDEGEKKIPVTIYKKKSEIEKIGGMKEVKGIFSALFDDVVANTVN